MRLQLAAAVLFTASALDSSGNLVQATCDTEANPVDISIGTSISCGLLPDGTVKCWGTAANGDTFEDTVPSPGGMGTVKRVLVSDNEAFPDYSLVCVITDTRDATCKYVNVGDTGLAATQDLTDFPWLQPPDNTRFSTFHNADHIGLSTNMICVAKDFESGGRNKVKTMCLHLPFTMRRTWDVFDTDVEDTEDEIDGLFHDFFSNPSAKHICKRMRGGRVDCRGDNTFGQSQPENINVDLRYWNDGVFDPVLIDSKAVAVGVDHTCAIKQDNTIWCWGNQYTETGTQARVPVVAGRTQIRIATSSPVQVHEGNGVPRAMVGGNGFTCYITNNALKCFNSGETPVKVTINSPTSSVFTVWAGGDRACVQVNSDTNLPEPGVTQCFTGVASSIGAANKYDASDALYIDQPSFHALPLGCAPNVNCVTTSDDGSSNYNLDLTRIPLAFGDVATVEGGDADSYFGVTYSFHPEQFLPPGVHSAMFAYIVPASMYVSPASTAMNDWVAQYECVLTLSDAPFSTRINKKCFSLSSSTDSLDTYQAKIVLRTCLVNACTSYTEASDIYGTDSSTPYTVVQATAAEVFSGVDALDQLTMCPYLSILDFEVTVPIGNLVESTQTIDLNWARDDVTDAEGSEATSVVPINDDLSQDADWAICDRALDTTVKDDGYDYQSCFLQVNPIGNSRVVQLSKTTATTADTLNQLAMAFRLHADDQRLVRNGFLTLIPEKTSLNLFHADYPGTTKTGATCIGAGTGATTGCTQVTFSAGLAAKPYVIYTKDASLVSAHTIEEYEVAFQGGLPIFSPNMGCGDGGKFCTIVMEMTFTMGETRRRLVTRQVELPMRMLGEDSEGTDYTVALAVADDADLGSGDSTDNVLSTVVPGVGGLLVVTAGVAMLMRRRGKDEDLKEYDVENQGK